MRGERVGFVCSVKRNQSCTSIVCMYVCMYVCMHDMYCVQASVGVYRIVYSSFW